MERIRKAKLVLGADVSKEYLKFRQKFIHIKKLKKQRLLLNKLKQRLPNPRLEIEIINHGLKTAQPERVSVDKGPQTSNEPEIEISKEEKLLLENVNSGKFSIIINLETNSVRFEPEPKHRKKNERYLKIEDFEEYETDAQPDFDYIADEWGLDFLSDMTSGLEQKLFELKSKSLCRYLGMFEYVSNVFKILTHRKLTDNKIYNSRHFYYMRTIFLIL